MRCGSLTCLSLVTAVVELHAQDALSHTYERNVGDVSVHCSSSIATDRGTCTVSHDQQMRFALRTRFQQDSVLTEFFSIEGVWVTNDLTLRIDTLPPHTSPRSRPFGRSDTRAILQEIEYGHKMHIDFPDNAQGKLGRRTEDLSNLRGGIRLAHEYIRGLARPGASTVKNPSGPPLACVDGVAPPGTDTTSQALTRAEAAIMIIPPMNVPGKVRGKTMKVSMLVGVTGGVDSVTITGITDAGYIASVVRTASAYRFFPATVGGCTIPSWYAIEITLGG